MPTSAPAAPVIHLIAPSGYCHQQQAAGRGVRRLEAAGFQVTNQSVISRRYQRFAGTDSERLRDIQQLADLPSDNALVLAVRGGYGVSRLLADIDYARLAARWQRAPLLLCGHSDVTALQLALLAQAEIISFSGPMLAANFGAETLDPFSWQAFCQAISEEQFSLCWQCQASPVNVSGTLWGGNLAMLLSLVGTRWLPPVRDGILLLEDINEPLYRIERMLLQLRDAGILARQSAVIFGDFSQRATIEDDQAGYHWQTVLAQVRSWLDVPVLDGLAFGHQQQTVTVPLGAQGVLQHDGQQARLTIQGHPRLNQAGFLKYPTSVS